MWLVSVTRSQVWMGSRCVKFGVIALTLSYWSLEVQHGTSWQRTLWGSEKRIVALHKDGIGYKKIAKTLKLSCIKLGCMAVIPEGDLNPIEHLWDILKRMVEEHKVSNIHQLSDVVIKEWKRTPVATCEALVNSMHKRVNKIMRRWAQFGHFHLGGYSHLWPAV